MTTLAATLGWTREIVSENCASISLDKVLVPNYCVCVFFLKTFILILNALYERYD